MLGNVYGRLTILKDLGVYKKNRKVLCSCSCGNEKEVYLTSLKTGRTKSCGCLAKELSSKRLKNKPIGKRKKNGESVFNIIFCQYKNSANKRDIEFNLTRQQFKKLTKQTCYYCGEPPSKIRKNKYSTGDYTYNGVDRLDNSKGYTIDNAVSCCSFCNISKNNYSIEYFYDKISKIYNNLKENKNAIN